MTYKPDPGGNFDSDTHRRVLAYVWNDEAQEFGELAQKIGEDPYHELESITDLTDVLKDLEAEGYVSESKKGWKRTKEGLGGDPGRAGRDGGSADGRPTNRIGDERIMNIELGKAHFTPAGLWWVSGADITSPEIRALIDAGQRPMMGGASFGNAVENKILDHIVSNTSYTMPVPYLALWTSTLDDTSTAATAGELTYMTYARQAVSLNQHVSGGVGLGHERRRDHVPGGSASGGTVTFWMLASSARARATTICLGHDHEYGDQHHSNSANLRHRIARDRARLSRIACVIHCLLLTMEAWLLKRRTFTPDEGRCRSLSRIHEPANQVDRAVKGEAVVALRDARSNRGAGDRARQSSVAGRPKAITAEARTQRASRSGVRHPNFKGGKVNVGGGYRADASPRYERFR